MSEGQQVFSVYPGGLPEELMLDIVKWILVIDNEDFITLGTSWIC